MEIKNPNSIQVDKKRYRVWDRITYTIEYCKKINTKATVYRALVNWTVTTYTPVQWNFSIWCRTAHKSDLVIPEYTEKDTYHIEATLEYQVNPIRVEKVYWRSVDFKVIR